MNYYDMETPREAALSREIERLKYENEHLKRMSNQDLTPTTMAVNDETRLIKNVSPYVDLKLAVMAQIDADSDGYHMMAQDFNATYPLKIGYYVSKEHIEHIHNYRADRVMIELHKRLIERFIRMEGGK